jgi:PA14 domain
MLQYSILFISLLLSLAPSTCLWATDQAQSGAMGTASGLTAFYFDNENFTGASVRTTDANIDFSWGEAPPKPGIAAHSFSVWWTGYITVPKTSIYNFRTVSDDGIVVDIDGKIIISNWTLHASTTNDGSIALEAGKLYPLNVRYFEGDGQNACRLQWQMGNAWQPIPASVFCHAVSFDPPVLGTGSGLQVAFFANKYLAGAMVDGGIRLPFVDWGSASPAIGIPSDGWSSAWGGWLETPVTGSYLLLFDSDDGISVSIDGQPVLDAHLAGSGNRAAFLTGQAGQRHSIQVMHRDEYTSAFLKIRWLYGSMVAPQAIPATQWYGMAPMSLGAGTGSGLTAKYYPNTGFCGPGVVIGGQQIDKWWPNVSPLPDFSNPGWSVEWDGEIEAPITDTYSFTLGSNDSGLVKLQDEVIINAISRHPFAAATSKAIPLVAGKRYRIHVQLANFTSVNVGAFLWWSGKLFTTRLIGMDRLYPEFAGSSQTFNCMVPKSSKVNPAWITFTGKAEGVSISLDDKKLALIAENATGGYLSSQSKPTGVTLKKGEASRLAIERNGIIEPGAIEWQVTDLATESGYDPLIVRVGDKLLVMDSTVGSKWTLAKDGLPNFVPDFTGVIGDTCEVSYEKPGIYTIVSRIDDKKENKVKVTVVGVNFNGPVACELTYQRQKLVDVSGGPEIGFFSKDTSMLGVESVRTGSQAVLKLQPNRSGTPVVQARLWTSTGPIIAEQEIDEFDIRTTATRRIVVDEQLPDGTYLFHATMLMDPYVPDLLLNMKIYIAGVTFDDSTLRRLVSTSIFSKDAQSAWSGVSYPYGMIRSPGVNSGLCHSFSVYQNGIQVSY